MKSKTKSLLYLTLLLTMVMVYTNCGAMAPAVQGIPGEGSSSSVSDYSNWYATNDKNLPSGAAAATLTWDLASELTYRGSAASQSGVTFQIQVKLITEASGAKRYEFSQPTLKTGTTALLIKNIHFRFNNMSLSSGNVFESVNRKIPANSTRDLGVIVNSDGSTAGRTLSLYVSPAATDKIGFYIQELEPTTFNPPKYSQLRMATGVLGKHCANCHGSDGGLTTGNYASIIQRVVAYSPETSELFVRMNNNPIMPPAGRISTAELEQIRDWILDGAPNN